MIWNWFGYFKNNKAQKTTNFNLTVRDLDMREGFPQDLNPGL